MNFGQYPITTHDSLDSRRESLDAALAAALERKPKVDIPEGFAARVASSMPSKQPARSDPSQTSFAAQSSFAVKIAYLSVALIVVSMLYLSRFGPQSMPEARGVLPTIEALLLLQFLAISLWLGVRSKA